MTEPVCPACAKNYLEAVNGGFAGFFLCPQHATMSVPQKPCGPITAEDIAEIRSIAENQPLGDDCKLLNRVADYLERNL